MYFSWTVFMGFVASSDMTNLCKSEICADIATQLRMKPLYPLAIYFFPTQLYSLFFFFIFGMYNSIFSIFPKHDFSKKKLILKLQSLHFLINRYFWPPRVSCILTFCTVSSWRCCAMIKERYIATGSQETSGQISTEFFLLCRKYFRKLNLLFCV